MTDLLRQKLCDIVTANGPSVADDPRRCGELLREAMPEDGAGVTALLRALEARVPARLALLTEPLSLAPLTSGLVRRLVDEQGLSEEAARWAVESWAVALGKGEGAAPAFGRPFPAYDHLLAPRRRRRLPWLLLAVTAAVAAAVGSRWWLGQRSEVRRITGRTEGVSCLALTPDGRRALAGCGDKSLRLWDVDSGAELMRLDGHQGTPHAVAVAPDGRLALSCGGEVQRLGDRITPVDCLVRAWDLQLGQSRPAFGAGYKVTEAVLAPSDKAPLPQAVRTKLAVLKDRRFDTQEEFLSELARLLGRGELERHQQAILALAAVEGYDGPVYHVAISPDGRLALACTGWFEYKEAEYVLKDRKTIPTDCVVRLYDTATGRQVRKLEGHKDPVWCAAFTPDGRRVVSGATDGTVRLWDAATGRELAKAELTGKARVTCLAVAPDGGTVLTGDDQSRLRLWRLDDLELLDEEARSEAVRAVTFSPDGQRALSGGDDNLLRLWQTDGLTELRHFPGHSRPVTDVAFLPDGGHALSASADGTIRVWRLPP